MGAQLNENKICVGGDVVLFIMFSVTLQQMNEQLIKLEIKMILHFRLCKIVQPT